MAHYALVDLSNLFARARHAVQGDAFTKAGMAMHITFRTLRMLHRDHKVSHVVLAADRGSWRADVYPAYKSARRLERASKTAAEQEEATVLREAQDALLEFFDTKTRCTVLAKPGIEADDFIARWIALHPADAHLILSGDSDFVQLIAPNVRIHDGMQERWLTAEGVFGRQGERLAFEIDSGSGKIKVRGPDPDFVAEPDWWRKALFVKILRGDAGDSVFSAYPGVRYHGSSKKSGICEAWADRHARGYDWNNVMNARWEKLDGVDPEGGKRSRMVTVREEFAINESLIDLTRQPDTVKDIMDQTIVAAVQAAPAGKVGWNFSRFCVAHDLKLLAREAQEHTAYLNAGYVL